MGRSKTYALVRFSSLGDVVMSFVVADAIKRRDADARILFVTKPAYADLCALSPSIDEVVILDGAIRSTARSIAARAPDVVIDLHANLRTTWLKHLLKRALPNPPVVTYRSHAVRRRIIASRLRRLAAPGKPLSTYGAYLETLGRFGISETSGPPRLVVPPDARERAAAFRLSRFGAVRTMVVVMPFARHGTKMWPIGRWAETIGRLIDDPAVAVLALGTADEILSLGGPLTTLRSDRFAIESPPTLVDHAALIAASDIVVAGDTGPMHIAEGLDKPLIAIFGGTSPSLGFAPANAHAVVVEVSDLPCRPCDIHGKNHCPRGHFSCMEGITSDRVIGTISRLMAEVEEV